MYKEIKKLINNVYKYMTATKYCTYGYLGYVDVVYPGEHIKTFETKVISIQLMV